MVLLLITIFITFERYAVLFFECLSEFFKLAILHVE